MGPTPPFLQGGPKPMGVEVSPPARFPRALSSVGDSLVPPSGLGRMQTFVFARTMDRDSTDRWFVDACYGHPKTRSDVLLSMLTTKLTVRARSARPPSHTSC